MYSAELRDGYGCRTDMGGCGAGIGVDCRTATGKLTAPHSARWQQMRAECQPGEAIPARLRHARRSASDVARDLSRTLDTVKELLDEFGEAVKRGD